MGLEMHHNGLILCDVANGHSPGLNHVVETRQGLGVLELTLQANKRFTHSCTSCYAYTFLH